MAQTIDYFYNKFLVRIDKEGSEIYSPAVVMELLESSTYDFIEETVKYLENTQQLRDALSTLHTPYSLALTVNPSNSEEMLATKPEDYLTLETARVIDSVSTVRTTKLIRKGEVNINRNNPNKKPTAEYPVVIQYQDYIACLGSANQTFVKGFYIARPTFGDVTANQETEVVVNLPDETLDKIMNKMVNIIHAKEGDPRYQLSYNQEQSQGKSNK